MRVSDPIPAYVLHARPYRETSLLLELLSAEHGRIGAVARGVRGARGQPLRAALQPLQPLAVTLRGHGELATLASAEVQGRAPAPTGDALLASFYVNELLVRLLPRQDPQPALFWRYAQLLGELADAADGTAVAWALRRFERDLLEAIGYGLQLERAADQSPLDVDGHYRYFAEHGAVAVRESTPGSLSGAALIALADDRMPTPALLPVIRRLLRERIAELLGGRPLRAWDLLSALPGPARER